MPGQPGLLPTSYVREEVLEQQFTDLLGRLNFDDEVLAWVREALHASHADERREQEEAIERLRAEYDRLQRRLDAMYVDKLDGRWTLPSSIGCRPNGARSRLAASARSIGTRPPTVLHGRRRADSRTCAECATAIRTARTVRKTSPAQLCTIELLLGGGEVVATLRQPFDLLAETTAIAARSAVAGTPTMTKSEIWLPGPVYN